MKLLLAIILVSGGALAGAPAAETNPAILSVTIDGKKYEIKEGEALTLPTNAVPGKSQLTVALSPLQPYQMGAWRFVHPRGLSVDDDHDAEARTVTLSIAQGPQLVLTDHGVGNVLKDLTGTLRQALLSQIPSKSKVVKREEVAPYAAAGRTGFTTAFTYRDEDGDEWRQQAWVIQRKGRAISIVSVAMNRDSVKADELAKTILDSIERAP